MERESLTPTLSMEWRGRASPRPSPFHGEGGIQKPERKKMLKAIMILYGESLPLRIAERVGVR